MPALASAMTARINDVQDLSIHAVHGAAAAPPVKGHRSLLALVVEVLYAVLVQPTPPRGTLGLNIMHRYLTALHCTATMIPLSKAYNAPRTEHWTLTCSLSPPLTHMTCFNHIIDRLQRFWTNYKQATCVSC
jgi:hypothetical protein